MGGGGGYLGYKLRKKEITQSSLDTFMVPEWSVCARARWGVWVLIPSDNFDFVANFAEGYRKLGFDFSGGRINFELECRRYDIVHLLWPEELTEWRQPTSQQIDEILARMDRWAQHSKNHHFGEQSVPSSLR